MFCSHVSVYHLCAWSPQMLEEGVGSPEIGVIDSCEPSIIMGAGVEFRSFVRTNLHYYLPSCVSSPVHVFEDVHCHISDTSYS